MPTQPYKLMDGTPVKGVTTILGNLGWNKSQLNIWAFRIGQKNPELKSPYQASEEAIHIGTVCHEMAECDIKGVPFDEGKYPSEIIEKARKPFDGYLDWRQDSNIELVASEVSLVSEQYRYGGTVDFVGKTKRGFIVGDFKTSNGTYADHLIQVRAYQQLLEECTEYKPIVGLHILRFAKESGDFHHHAYTALDEAWEAFKALLILDSIKHGLEKRAA